MSINEIRRGDTIISFDGDFHTVESKGVDKVKARRTEPPRHLKTFRAEDLFCVDFDDGLWQQTEPEKRR